MLFAWLVLRRRDDWGGNRPVAIFGERFAGKQNLFGFARCRRSVTGALAAAIVIAALIGSALVKPARLLATRIISTRLTGALIALGRGVFRGRKVASARSALGTPTATAPSTAAPSTAATVPAEVLTAAIIALAASIGTRRVFLRRIVLRRKILRSGGVGVGLALLRNVGLQLLVLERFGLVRMNLFGRLLLMGLNNVRIFEMSFVLKTRRRNLTGSHVIRVLCRVVHVG